MPTKQQTLTIIVDEKMADPIDLVTSSLERYVGQGQVHPAAFESVEGEIEARYPKGYLVIEED